MAENVVSLVPWAPTERCFKVFAVVGRELPGIEHASVAEHLVLS